MSYPVPVRNSYVSELSTPSPVIVLKELVAKLYREQNKVQQLLGTLGYALRSLNNLKQFLEVTPLMASRVTDTDGCLLVLFGEKGELYTEQSHAHTPQFKRVLQQSLKVVRAHFIETTNTPFTFVQFDRQLRLVLPSVACHNCPILHQQQEIGRLYIFSNDHQYVWSPTRRTLLQFIADQIAVAIANHHLSEKLHHSENRERELAIASEIQNQLLPRCCPQIWGLDIAADCQAANQVGGDYYDFIPVNYDQLRQSDWMCNNSATPDVPWSIVIGDVMGKGVPAGLIMTMTRGLLRAEVLNRKKPAQILQHLNRVMYADLENSHRFVTLFYSEYDPQTGILRYSNAAHHPLLLWCSETQTLKSLDTDGALIGLEADSQFYDAEIQLTPGDVILYYTDGLTDAVNSLGQRFDEDNLKSVFQNACQTQQRASEILSHIYQAIETFIHETPSNKGHQFAQDDMTAVVLRVRLTQ